MSVIIPASIKNKKVSVPCGSYVVANNNDYYLRFSFDDEWNEYPLKTARFVINNEYSDVDFSGDTVNVPAITDSALFEIAVGVYAGGLSTTTPAKLLVYASVLGLPTSGQYQPDDPGTLLPNIEELDGADTFIATDVSEGVRGKATMQQIVDLAEEQFGVQPSDTYPVMDSTAYIGTSAKYARADHVHPRDQVLQNQINSLNNRAVTWDAKQNALTFDAAPTPGSNNPVTSNGIYAAIGGKIGYEDDAWVVPLTIEGNAVYCDVPAADIMSALNTQTKVEFRYHYEITLGNSYRNGDAIYVPVDAKQSGIIGDDPQWTLTLVRNQDSGTAVEKIVLVWTRVHDEYVFTSGTLTTIQNSATAVLYTEQSLTNAQQNQARTNIGAASQADFSAYRPTFPVTYGVTTYAAIASAYAAGKLPVCDMSGNMYQLVALYSTRAIFRHNNMVGDGSTVATVTCTYNNVWSGSEADYYTADQVDALAANAVKYTAQSLTDNQKAQARTNIGAASAADLAGKAVKPNIIEWTRTNNVWSTTATAAEIDTAIGLARLGTKPLIMRLMYSDIPIDLTTFADGNNTVLAPNIAYYNFSAIRDEISDVGDEDNMARPCEHVLSFGIKTIRTQPDVELEIVDVSVWTEWLPFFYEIPSASSATPQALGTAAAGSSADYSRADHVHDFNADFKTALLQLAAKVAYIDGNGQTYYDALEAALTHRTLSSITAVFTQGTNVIYDTDSLETLRQYLTVTAHYSDSTTATVTGYTLSGTLTEGTSTITVSYGGKTTTFNVTVSGPQVLSGYTEVGTPAISNGILSVTEGNFIKTPQPFDPEDSTWKVTCKYKITGSLGSYADVFGSVSDTNASKSGLLLELNNTDKRHGATFLSSNGTSWDIANTSNNFYLSAAAASNWVWFTIEYDGSAYVSSYSLDGESYTQLRSVSSSSKVKGGFAVAYGLKRNGVFNGDIDLNECKIYIDGVLWWKAIA